MPSSDDASYGQPGDDKLDVGDVRRVVANVLVVVGTVLLIVGGVTLYLREEVFDADHFADRSAEALKDDDVRQVLADEIVDQIIAQGSAELIQAKPLLQATVATVLGSAPFRAIFRKGAVQVHRALFDRDKGSVVLDLADTGTVVISATKAVAPGVARKIPRTSRPASSRFPTARSRRARWRSPTKSASSASCCRSCRWCASCSRSSSATTAGAPR